MTERSLGNAPSIPLDKIRWRPEGKPRTRDGRAKSQFIPYLRAPDLAALLDEWVGPENWTDEYTPGTVDGKPVMWATLKIRVNGEWISKTDLGVPSNFEGAKGNVSDAFKRVGSLKWGVGRNVYNLPEVWAPCRVVARTVKDRNGNDRKVENVYLTPDTIPSLQQQLRDQGFDPNEFGGVDGDDSDEIPETPSSDSAPPANEATSEEGRTGALGNHIDEDDDTPRLTPDDDLFQAWLELGQTMRDMLGEKAVEDFKAWCKEKPSRNGKPRTERQYNEKVEWVQDRFRADNGGPHAWDPAELIAANAAIAKLAKDAEKNSAAARDWQEFLVFTFHEFAPVSPELWTTSQRAKLLPYLRLGDATTTDAGQKEDADVDDTTGERAAA